jgi:hypothetical protein
MHIATRVVAQTARLRVRQMPFAWSGAQVPISRIAGHVSNGTTPHEAKSSCTKIVQRRGVHHFSPPSKLPVNPMAAEAFEGPDVLRFDVAEEIAVAGLREDAEVGFAGGVPAILDLGDGQKGVTEFEDARRFVGLITRIADDLDRLHKFIGS